MKGFSFFFKKLGLSNALAAVLTLLGLLQMAAISTGMEDLADFMDSLALSPKPDPMSAASGFENYAHEYLIELIGPDGQILKIPIDESFVEKMGGPHRYSVVYLIGISWAPRFESKLPKTLLENTFCKKSKLSERLGIFTNPREVRIRLDGKKGIDSHFEYRVKCS